MVKMRIWFVVFLIPVLIAVPLTYVVLTKEKAKNNAKMQAQLVYFQNLGLSIEDYRAARLYYIKSETENNLLGMIAAHSAYETLLLQQDSLIKKNQTVTKNTTVTSSTASTSSSSSTASKPASKPSSSTTTKTS